MAINYLDEFLFVSEAYNGIGGFADGSHIDEFKREDDDGYTERKEASVREYENLYSSKVSRYVGYLFKSPPVRETENELIDGIKKNAKVSAWLGTMDVNNPRASAKAARLKLIFIII